jgi:FixJ family two-component response regulator
MTQPFFFEPQEAGDLDDQINEMYRLKHEQLAAEAERRDKIRAQFPDLEIRDRCIWNLWFNKTMKKNIAATFGISKDRVQQVLDRAKRDGKRWHQREAMRDDVQEFDLTNCSAPMLESRIALLQALADYEWSKA